MTTSLMRLVIACVLCGASLAAFAAHGGSRGLAGGMSFGHMSAAGVTNTNGPNAADRDKGQARAEDRMSAAGASHQRAHQAHGKGKRHRPQALLTEQQR